jgi:4-hydroxythreonine-4-phosphate dehydrogenase
MFVVHDLKIFFTTRHMSLREALDAIDQRAVRRAIDGAWTALRVLGHERPALAVAAVNPHGGEGGRFGREEIDAIAPACAAARDDGLDVLGPIPADSVFHQGVEGRFDAVLCHFHDQGHIAAKTLDFDGTVSVTIGLPIIRTSVDHGTAFDIAGTGQASPATMASAYAAAARFAPYADRAREVYGSDH